MPSVLAIVSKAVFERAARVNGAPVVPGQVWPIDRYPSKNKGLAPLGQGGDLFLVTVRPPDERLWLVAVLAQPTFTNDAWHAAANTTTVRDISALRGRLRFATGKGITAKPGALSRSLQTPRTLTDDDARLLRDDGSPPPRPDAPPAPIVGETTLERALSALRDERWIPALERLLEAWDEHKSAEIAELVEQLGEVLDRALPPLKGRPRGSTLRDSGLDALACRHSIDVGRVVARFDDATAKTLLVWFRALQQFPADPRIPFNALRAASKFSAHTSGFVQTAAVRLAEKAGDGRILTYLAFGAEHLRFADQLARLASKLAPCPPLLPEQIDVVDALRDAVTALSRRPPPTAEQVYATKPKDSGAAQGQALLDAVLADPGAEEPRLVYADWLSERNDPRGELIMLQHTKRTGQLSGAQRNREKDLIKEHGARWLHPLDSAVVRPRFKLGFLRAAQRVELKTKRQRKLLLHHPLWSTLEEVDEHLDAELLLGGALKSLRACATDAETLRQLSQLSAPPPLERVFATWIRLGELHEQRQQEYAPHGLQHWREVAKVGSLKRLTHLDVRQEDWTQSGRYNTMEAYRWLWGTPLARQLRRVGIYNGGTELLLQGFMDVFADHSRMESVDLCCAWGPHESTVFYHAWRFGRPQAGVYPLTLTFRRVFDTTFISRVQDLLRSAVAGFPDPRVPELIMAYDGPQKQGHAQLETWAEAVEDKFPRVVLRTKKKPARR